METEWVDIKRGLRQGCNLSILLFCLYTEELIRRVKSKGKRMKVGNDNLSLFLYADDIILFGDSSTDLQDELQILAKYGLDFDVRFSSEKRDLVLLFLVINGNGDNENSDTSWKLRPLEIKRTKEYKYLGVTVNEEGMKKESQEKLFKAQHWLGR